MNKVLSAIIIISISTNFIFCQCDAERYFINNVKELNCCEDILNIKNKISTNDTMQLKFCFYDLLCDDKVDMTTYNAIADSIMVLYNRISYSGTESSEWQFLSQHRKRIRTLKKDVFEKGYKRCLDEKDYLNASKFAKYISRCFSLLDEHEKRIEWQQLVLSNYETYAKDDFIKLLKFHLSDIFREVYSISTKGNRFNGYEHLLKIISDQFTKAEFQFLLDSIIESAFIYQSNHGGRQYFSLIFKISEESFAFYEPKISKLYMRDTILADTMSISNCYGNYADDWDRLKIVYDTIENKIDNFNEMTVYKNRLRKSVLFNIVNDIKE